MPGYPIDRVIVYNRDATFAFELTPDEQRSRKRIEEVNGEHSLTIKTTRKLSEGMRLITQDDTGKIREHVVYKVDEDHHEGKCAVGTYLCMWSLQYDLMSTYAKNHAEPGMGSSCTSRNAIIAALDGQSLWVVGTCDAPSVAKGKGCVMIGVSAWERMSLVVKHWHGEIDAEIVMDGTRVTERKVNFRAHLGSSEVKRRFDWTEDLTSIERHEDSGPYYCRVVPLGRGQREYAEDDETEFDWPLDITEETGGIEYIEDSESALVFRTKLPNGTYHYPTKVVKYDEDDPELLLAAAQADLHNHTRPGCSYEANVLQFVRAGMDAHGLALGDNTQCVDFGFNPDAGLALEGRVTRLEVEELSPETETNVTIGDLAPTFAQTMKALIGAQTTSISDGVKRIEGAGTIAYVENLLDAINAQIAADGGYTYLVEGQGTITYDKTVADPLIGREATQVTQMKGGSLRFANSKNPSFSGINDWDWTTVITSEGFLGLAATIGALTTGYIGSQNKGSYWNLDSGQLTTIKANIGGFVIDVNSIHTSGYASDSTDSGALWLSSSTFTRSINGTSRGGLKFAIGGNFAVSSSGYLYASNVVISGSITATSGAIGGFVIDSNSIHTSGYTSSSTDSGALWLSSSTFTRSINGTSRSGLKFAIGDNFGVSSSGYLYAADADISGSINSSTITGGTINGTEIVGGTITGATLTSVKDSSKVVIENGAIKFPFPTGSYEEATIHSGAASGGYASLYIEGGGTQINMYSNILSLNASIYQLRISSSGIQAGRYHSSSSSWTYTTLFS